MAARLLDFNRFPRSSRERFIACLRGQSGPRPIFQNAGGGGAIAGWSILGIAAIVGLFFVVSMGYGSIYEIKQSPGFLLPYAAAFFFFGLSVLGLIRRIRMGSVLPFTPGVYVFTLDVVVANSKDFEIYPMADLATLQPVHHYRNGFYTHTAFHFHFVGGKSFSFSSNNKAYAESQLVGLRQSQQQLDDAIARKDVYGLAALDPFFEMRMNGWQEVPQAPDNLMAGSIPRWMSLGWAVGLALTVLSVPVWFVRNLLSDEKAFAEMKRETDAKSSGPYSYSYIDSYDWERYIYKGGRHAEEARNVWIPKLDLRKAQAEGKPEAIQDFLDKHPGSSVDAEAKTALADALHVEFTKAKDAKTVAALRDFAKKWPKAADAPTAKAEIHKLFEKTLADFRPQANKKDPTVLPFVENLIAYEEEHDSPPVAVRFRGHNSASLKAADKILASEDDTAGLAMVSDHFEVDDNQKREETMVAALGRAFATVFPADVLPLKLGDPLPEKDKMPATVSLPTIIVDYEVGWSGDTYVNKSESRRFVGIKISFDTLMQLPSYDKTMKFKLSVLPPDRFTVDYSTFSDPLYGSALAGTAGGGGPSDTAVYDVMALRAFDQLSTKMEQVFFREAPKAAPLPKGGLGKGTGKSGTLGGADQDDDPGY